jgi:uncharacterized protein YbjT (DUF2867 family)
MILVAGGTGNLGRPLVSLLLAQGHSVRVMAKGAAAATGLAEQGAELFTGDVRDPAAVLAAMGDAEVCVSAVQGMAGTAGVTPASVDRDGNRNLIDAAASTGAAVVLLSSVEARAGHPMEINHMKWEAEEHLKASGVQWTIVRGTVFAETWRGILRGTAKGAGRIQVFGRGENPINFVTVDDVVKAVARAVTDASLRGQVVSVGGPENLTLNEFARLADSAGREPRHVPRPMLRAMAVVAGPVKPELARMARAAIHMDTGDLAFDPAPSRTAYPWLTCTSVRNGV